MSCIDRIPAHQIPSIIGCGCTLTAPFKQLIIIHVMRNSKSKNVILHVNTDQAKLHMAPGDLSGDKFVCHA